MTRRHNKNWASAIPVSGRIALSTLLLSMLLCTPGFAARTILDTPQIRVYRELPDQINNGVATEFHSCCVYLKQLDQNTSNRAPASVSLKTLFSAQADSWMFESLVHNGLFEIASGYQPSHPQAIYIQDGTISLNQLFAALDNPRIIERTSVAGSMAQPVYQLHYPIIIGPNAGLFIQAAELRMNADSGAALINLGRLIIRNADLASNGKNLKGGKHFRPFLLAWNGSETAIIDSRLHQLGYNRFLSQGLTIAHHKSIQRQTRARLLLSGSSLAQFESGLITNDADLFVADTAITDARRFGMDISGGRVTMTQSEITTTHYNSGIRITNTAEILLSGNRIADTRKAGIQIAGRVRRAMVTGNSIDNAGTDGLAFRDIDQTMGQSLVIRGNALTGNTKSGIRLSGAPAVRVTKNSMIANGEYGINIDHSRFLGGQAPLDGTPIVLAGNQLSGNHIASIKSVQGGRLMLAANQFQMAPTYQSIFAGDLISIQNALLNYMISEQLVVEIIP